MKRHLPILFLLGCAVAFVFGVLELFKLRFEVGDVYPPYSSLRSDPLGTMAFYESLDALPGLAPRRDFTVANRLPDGKGTTYLHVAASTYEWRWLDKALFGEIERFLARGGRLVITLYPQTFDYQLAPDSRDEPDSPPAKDSKSKTDKGDSGPEKSKAKKPPRKRDREKERDEDVDFISINDRWGVEFELINLEQGSNDVFEAAVVTNQTAWPLPRTLAWHSGLVLTNLDRAWHTVYARGANPVVVERKFGPGSVVIATDSWFLSNEALQQDRHADFLTWLVGPNPKIFFDEAHLGVTESGGVATLMRKYRLEGLIAGLALLTGLFIWKNSASFVPPHAAGPPPGFVSGKEAAAGFVNLLRRSLHPRSLLDICFAEWKKSAVQTRKYSAARRQQAEAIYEADKAAKARDPLKTYRRICGVLSSSKFQVPGSEFENSTLKKRRLDENQSL